MQYPEVAAMARHTHNVMRRDVLSKVVSNVTISRWISRGILLPITSQVVCFSAMPTWRERLHAFHLSTQYVASHRSALRLWGLSPIAVGQFEFTAPPDPTRVRSGMFLHESNYMPASHWRVVDGTAVTSPARAVLETSAVWWPERLRELVNNALDSRLTSIAELRRTHEAMRRRGRRRTTFLAPILDDPYYDDPKNRSELERKARHLIKRAGLPLPISQNAVVLEHATLHPDFCYPDIRLAVELDGFSAHGTRKGFDDDRERDAYLAMVGWQVVRFSDKTIHMLVPLIKRKLEVAS